MALDSFFGQYGILFKPNCGWYTDSSVTQNQSKEAKVHQARPIPQGLEPKVESTLLKMEKDGVINIVQLCCNCSLHCDS